MKASVAALAAVSVAVTALLAQTNRANDVPQARPTADKRSDPALIAQMEEDRVRAGVRKDIAAISAVTAEDYLQIDLDGTLLDKAAALRRIASPEFQLQSNTLDDMVVRMFGETAVVTARSSPKGTRNGKDFDTPIRYSRIYVKRGGRWQVVVFQMTRVSGT